MKKVIYIVASVALLSSCGGGSSVSPEDLGKKYCDCKGTEEAEKCIEDVFKEVETELKGDLDAQKKFNKIVNDCIAGKH